MAEWPKKLPVGPPRATRESIERGDAMSVEYGELEVVPADLGRKLYEALRAIDRRLESWQTPPGTSDLLARYEREVQQ